jgi:hypothetical protein
VLGEAIVGSLRVAQFVLDKIGVETGKKQVETVAHGRDDLGDVSTLSESEMPFTPRFQTCLWTSNGIGLPGGYDSAGIAIDILRWMPSAMITNRLCRRQGTSV